MRAFDEAKIVLGAARADAVRAAPAGVRCGRPALEPKRPKESPGLARLARLARLALN